MFERLFCFRAAARLPELLKKTAAFHCFCTDKTGFGVIMPFGFWLHLIFGQKDNAAAVPHIKNERPAGPAAARTELFY